MHWNSISVDDNVFFLTNREMSKRENYGRTKQKKNEENKTDAIDGK